MTLQEAVAQFPCVDLSGLNRKVAEREIWRIDPPSRGSVILQIAVEHHAIPGLVEWRVVGRLPPW